MTDRARPRRSCCSACRQEEAQAQARQAEDLLRRLGRRRQDLRDAGRGARRAGRRASTWSSAWSRPTAAPRPRRMVARPASGCRCKDVRLPRPRAAGVRPRRGARRASRALILVDELAHSNAPGSRHPKRWQDVEELLDAGIDVWSTMNVQHLESLNDVVSGITGIRVWETVPDRVFDEADEVVLVDLPPDELLQRLKEGKVYLPQQAERAVRNFFRKGNLHRAARAGAAPHRRPRRRRDAGIPARPARWQPVWQTREALLPASAPASTARSWCAPRPAWRRSSTCRGTAVYVETPRLQRLPEAARASRCCACSSWPRSSAPSTATLAGRTSRRRCRQLRARAQPVARWCSAATPGARWRLARHAGRAQSARWRRPRRDADRVAGARSAGAAGHAAARRAPRRRSGRWAWQRLCLGASRSAPLTTLLAAPLLGGARADQHRHAVPARGGRRGACATAAGRRCWPRSSAWRCSTSSSCRRASPSPSATCSTC